MVIVTLDLSVPATVLPSARKWLAIVSDRLQTTFERLEKRGNKLPEQLRLRARKVIFGGHADADTVVPSGRLGCVLVRHAKKAGKGIAAFHRVSACSEGRDSRVWVLGYCFMRCLGCAGRFGSYLVAIFGRLDDWAVQWVGCF